MRITPGSDILKMLLKARADEAIFIEGGQYRGMDQMVANKPGIRVVSDGLVVIAGGQNGLKFDQCNGLYVAGLTCRNAQHHGIFVVNSLNIEITGNHCEGNMHNGVLAGNSSKVKINNNFCNNNGKSGAGHGIYISQSGDDIQIENNTANDNGSAGIQVNAHDEHPGADKAHDQITDGLIVQNNNLDGNQKAGHGACINIACCHNGQILGNHITHHKGRNGIALFTDAPLNSKQFACRDFDIDDNSFQFDYQAQQNILIGPDSKNIRTGTRNRYDGRYKAVEGV